MISVEQIHRLENRIERALGMLAELRETNASLTSQLQAANAGAVETARKLEESESARLAAEQTLRQLRTDQEEIEATINRTLHQLDVLEVDLTAPEADSPPEAESPPAPPAAESVAAAEVAAAPAAAEPPADSLAAEPAKRAVSPPEQATPEQDAGGEEQSDAADATATTEEEAAPSREGAELDIF